MMVLPSSMRSQCMLETYMFGKYQQNAEKKVYKKWRRDLSVELEKRKTINNDQGPVIVRLFFV